MNFSPASYSQSWEQYGNISQIIPYIGELLGRVNPNIGELLGRVNPNIGELLRQEKSIKGLLLGHRNPTEGKFLGHGKPFMGGGKLCEILVLRLILVASFGIFSQTDFIHRL